MKPITFHTEVYPRLNSTNETLLERRNEKNFHGLVICAEEQSAGRGRRGRVWQSLPGNLHFSIGFHLTKAEQPIIPWMPFFAGIVMYEVLAQYIKADMLESLSLKWPNDIVWQEKKLCGILSQIRQEGEHYYLVLGIGLNLQAAPKDLPAVALSALPLQKTLPTLPEFLSEIIREMQKHYPHLQRLDLVKKAWEKRAKFLGKHIHYGNSTEPSTMKPALAVALNEDGSLAVKDLTTNQFASLVSEDMSIR